MLRVEKRTVIEECWLEPGDIIEFQPYTADYDEEPELYMLVKFPSNALGLMRDFGYVETQKTIGLQFEKNAELCRPAVINYQSLKSVMLSYYRGRYGGKIEDVILTHCGSLFGMVSTSPTAVPKDNRPPVKGGIQNREI